MGVNLGGVGDVPVKKATAPRLVTMVQTGWRRLMGCGAKGTTSSRRLYSCPPLRLKMGSSGG